MCEETTLVSERHSDGAKTGVEKGATTTFLNNDVTLYAHACRHAFSRGSRVYKKEWRVSASGEMAGRH